MNTKALRIDLTETDDIAGAIQNMGDEQLKQGYKLVASFTWGADLVLIFQKLS